MIARARTQETVFRHGPGGREPLAAPNEGGSHVHYSSLQRSGLGCITSTPLGHKPLTFEEMLALKLGVTLVEARRLLAEGKLS